MRQNFRTKTYTTRLTRITNSQISKIRATALKNAGKYKNAAARKKFINSHGFEKLLRKNIRQNRVKANVRTLQNIGKELRLDKTQLSGLRSIFGEKTAYNPRTKKIYKTNTFTSLKATMKLKRAAAKVKRGTFSTRQYAAQLERFKETKKYLDQAGGQISDKEILTSLNRTVFYYENKQVIIKHNENIEKYGYYEAQDMKAGKILSELNKQERALQNSMDLEHIIEVLSSE